jgi:RNA polymerase sigma-70 factor (ECF subfamily)
MKAKIMEKPDEQIMQEFMAGDNEAISLIFTRYKSRIFNFCLRFLGNRADAEDITSDVFLKLFHRQYSLISGAKFSTWLFTIAHNACFSRLRKKKPVVFSDAWNSDRGRSVEDMLPDPSDSSSDKLISKERAEVLHKALNVLADEQKEALILKEFHHFSYLEIAEILGCSLDKVKVLIFRARERLKVELTAFIKKEEL